MTPFPILYNFLDQAHRVLLREQSLRYEHTTWTSTSSKELSVHSEMSIDTETTGLNPRRDRVVGISLSVGKDTAQVVKAEEVAGTPAPHVKIIAHNWAFDAPALAQLGWVLDCEFDTMIAAYVLGYKRVGLKWLSEEVLGIKMQGIDDLILKGKYTMADVPWSLTVPYAGADADITKQLKGVFRERLAQEPKLQSVFETEMRLLPLLIRMSDVGAKLDVETLAGMGEELWKERATLKRQVKAFSPNPEFNPDSPAQVSNLLFGVLGLEPRRSTDTPGQFATGKDSLEEQAGEHAVIELLLRYRQVSKLLAGFIEKLPKEVDPLTGRIHPNWRQTVVVSGRLSCEPNLMNIPIRGWIGEAIRACFVAEEGNLIVGADYKALEVRVLAHLCGDANLCQIILDGKDPHALTASFIFQVPYDEVAAKMRDVSKTAFFALVYKAGPMRISKLLKPFLTEAEATELVERKGRRAGQRPYLALAKIVIEGIYATYPGIRLWQEAEIAKARKLGYTESLLGRRAYVPYINDESEKTRAEQERFVCNFPVQATASGDIVKLGMIELWDTFKSKDWYMPFLQVHDELQAEVPYEFSDELKWATEGILPNVVKLDVPLEVDCKVGKTWAETH